MRNAYFHVPKPSNEPVRAYLKGSEERRLLKEELDAQAGRIVDIPLIIGGKEIFTDETAEVVMPHDHGHVLARHSIAGENELKAAIDASVGAKAAWAGMPWEHRAAIFLRAAEFLAGPWRYKINAATMLGQSKTAYQAEIDSACELTDFLRFGAYYAEQIFNIQPENAPAIWNRLLYRPLDGFVAAITPFNFTSIAGNLGAAPAMLGNTVIWKPGTTSILSCYYFMRLLMEAGLPAGVMNFVPSRGSDISKYVISDRGLGGVHFTGSTSVFQTIWQNVGANIANYASYPRLVGETGGKDFVFAHKSADIGVLVSALVRGSFEYQGQKCSAASRAFIPYSIWEEVRERLLSAISVLKMGDIRDFRNFMGAVIDKASFDNIKGYIERAKANPDTEVLCGGYDDSKGYFVSPTVILCETPYAEPMVKEIFGPVLSLYVYPDADLKETLAACDSASAYALTGAVIAADRGAIIQISEALQGAAGNFYINDKPTGAVIGQQPFGGGRASGTNDKAGSVFNMLRWVNTQTIKENLLPTNEIIYPYMDAE
ncbi:MAG: L-glutamate gamma-semialdehyde dehydrogenase [Clostridiales bacterium]|jgi:1-pyrroline-5-carboxylate dehydrogenase|nr:L-glutamate gamma-semialdehyde dehydrogenase [Clostridiales bacterium]